VACVTCTEGTGMHVRLRNMDKVMSFVFFFVNLCIASKVAEIGKISVVMYVSDHFVGILSMGNCS